MFSNYSGVDTPADIEDGGKSHKAWLGSGYQIRENLVGNGLMKSPLIPVGPDIEFEGFEFYTLLVRNVLQIKCGKIGLSCFGAETGKFRGMDTDRVVTFRMRVIKNLQCFARVGGHRMILIL
jgi:hypothetical protein